MTEAIFDYIIVGAGTAGSVLARRLADESDYSVCVVEAGNTFDDQDWAIRMPGGVYKLSPDVLHGSCLFDWGYFTVPQIHLNNRVIRMARGKVVGGSSSVNWMIHVQSNLSS